MARMIQQESAMAKFSGAPVATKTHSRHDDRMSTTVLIVDDHAGFRELAGRMLESAGYAVVGEAHDAASALAAVARLHPDVVLLDIQLPDLDGFAVSERLAARDDPPTVVLISTRAESAYRRRLAGSPARGFIAKSELSGPTLAALVS
jgi:DNA-binding NarL/FixJ family response regulator